VLRLAETREDSIRVIGFRTIGGPRIIRCFLIALALTSTGLAAAVLQTHDYRDPFLQPFASSSLWNTSLGSAARWSKPEDADARDLHAPGPAVNAGEWSMPYFIAAPDQPKLLFRDRDPNRPIANQRIAAPGGIHPALPIDGDRHIILFDPSKRFMFHYFDCSGTAEGFDCALAQKDDTCKTGLGGYGWGTGVIRRWELEAGGIEHMLRFSLPMTLTKSGGNRPGGEAWPATGEDYFGPQKYSGHVLFGSTIGIPASVDIDALGLSPSGRVLAKTLQDYGALQRDTGGERGIIFYAEESAESLPQLQAMRADLPKIVPYLQVLRNQGPATPNGGGARRRPTVAPLDPKVCRSR
jgi:hypothetical protein